MSYCQVSYSAFQLGVFEQLEAMPFSHQETEYRLFESVYRVMSI